MAPDDDSVARWRVDSPIDLEAIGATTTDGAPGKKDGGDKKTARKALEELKPELFELQTRLWAEDRQALLVVLQSMDAGGKDGAIKKVFSGFNPQGVRVTSFRKPTETELEHDFLWRVHHACPGAGEIGIFNRSHYEDVVAVRVRGIAAEEIWRPRFRAICDFERMLVDAGTTVVKLFLHISPDEQLERFRARLDTPEKRWKFRAGDLDDRAKWSDFMAAYSQAINETSTEHAPWYVIPADKKWYRDFAVATIVQTTLRKMNPQYPQLDRPDFELS